MIRPRHPTSSPSPTTGGSRCPSSRRSPSPTNQDDGYWIQAVDITGNGTPRPGHVGPGRGGGGLVREPDVDEAGHRQPPLPRCHRSRATSPATVATTSSSPTTTATACSGAVRRTERLRGWRTRAPSTTAPPGMWHFITDLMAAHRLQLGHFTQSDRLELLALPVVGCQPFGKGVHEPVSVTLFERPADVLARSRSGRAGPSTTRASASFTAWPGTVSEVAPAKASIRCCWPARRGWSCSHPPTAIPRR